MLRVQIGHGTHQSHTIHCVRCGEPLTFSLDLDQENTGIAFHLGQNCAAGDSEEGTPVYVSQDMLADPTQIHDPMYFPSIKIGEMLIAHPRGQRLLRDASSTKPGMISDLWRQVQKIWRLNNARQYAVANAFAEDFARVHSIERSVLREILFWFGSGIFDPDEALREEIRKVASKHQGEFARFLHYYYVKLRPQDRRSLFDIYTKFFDAFGEFAQVLMFVRLGEPLPEHLKTTSTDFMKVQRFYADAYEFFAGNVAMLACINNIRSGRKFDQLANISLSKYLETNKATRRDTFSACPQFMAATSEFDNDIRNASFHNWFFLASDNETIEFRPGGTGRLQTIKYVDYLWKCVKLFEQINDLLMVSVLFEEAVCENTVVQYPDWMGAQKRRSERESLFLVSAGFRERDPMRR